MKINLFCTKHKICKSSNLDLHRCKATRKQKSKLNPGKLIPVAFLGSVPRLTYHPRTRREIRAPQP